MYPDVVHFGSFSYFCNSLKNWIKTASMKRKRNGLIGLGIVLALVWLGLLFSLVNLTVRAFEGQKELFHAKVDAVFTESLKRIDTIDFNLINTYIGEELQKNGLYEVYQLGIYCEEEQVFQFVTPNADTSKLLTEGFVYNLLNITDEEAHLDTLYIYFPFIEKRFHWDILMAHAMITLLLILLLVCFISFAIIISRQRKLNEFRERMVNNITHELKTPLTTISLASQLLLDDTVEKTADVQHSYLRMISDETKAMQNLVDEALEVFRNTRTTRERTDIVVNELLTTVVEVHRLSLNECQGNVVFDLQASDDVVYGDLPHLANAFSNLIDNAIKYRSKDPLVITISTRNVDESIEISFKDNGIGISHENQKLIFEPFTRVNTDNKYYVKGYGLGLNYVMHIVEYHKGTIKLESELGKGSNFIITLPLKLKGILI